ncbi:MAG: hypothetical protein ABI363_05985 [Nitrosospira sp.]
MSESFPDVLRYFRLSIRIPYFLFCNTRDTGDFDHRPSIRSDDESLSGSFFVLILLLFG